MEKINRPPKPDWFTSVEKDYDRILEEFKKANDAFRCAYTDVPLHLKQNKQKGKFLAVIDRFKPISKFPNLANNWNNLLVVSEEAKQYKGEEYNAFLLNPTNHDYDFDKYFRISLRNHKIYPNTNIKKKEKKQAKFSIKILGLNNTNLIFYRKTAVQQYHNFTNLSVTEQNLLSKTSINTDTFLNINKSICRFYLKRVIKQIKEKEKRIGKPVDISLINKEIYSLAKDIVKVPTKKPPNNNLFEANEFIYEIHINKFKTLSNIHLKNLSTKKEIYFFGKNGSGKTLLLQVITIVLQGLNISILDESINRQSTNDFSILLLDNKENDYIYDSSSTNIINKIAFGGVINKNVFAYGMHRLNYNSQISSKNKGYLTLFDSNAYLINPISWLKEVERKELKGIGKLKLTTAIEVLQELLENRVEIKETEEGDYVFHERGTIVSFEQLSDGYRSTLLWLCDLLSRLASQQPKVSALKDYKAIVLVDEIGAFLHPRWAVSLVKKLRNLFPNIQWIFTTHSPIVTLGASEDAVFFKLYKENGITKVSEPFDEPLSMTANSLLTSMLWDLENFTTRAVKPQDVSSDDYVYQKIHQVISQKIQDMPAITDEEIWKMIEKEFEKIKDK